MFFKMFDGDIVDTTFIKCVTPIKIIKEKSSIKYIFYIYYKDNGKHYYQIEISLDNIIKCIDHIEFSEEFIKFKENHSNLMKRLLNE